jgi:septal ring factor EnvC (AmiA/AmiB activator)
VGGLAATVVNFVKVKEVITNTIKERDDEKTAKLAALEDARKTHATLKTTQAKLDTTTRELTKTKADLDTANASIADLTTQNGTLTQDLAKARQERDKSDQELSKWQQLHVTPQEVIDTEAELKTTTASRDAFIAENKLLNKKVGELTNEIALLTGTDTDPLLPAGLKGTVTAVDPKYGFVVLNIGEDSGVVRRGVMIVARGDKFIGKVRISKVENNTSVANVIPSWSQGPIMEGDQVLY